jgi:hypothetical protein
MITCENIKVWWLFQTWPSSLPVEEDQVGGDLLLLGRCGAWRGPGEFTTLGALSVSQFMDLCTDELRYFSLGDSKILLGSFYDALSI